MIIIFRSSINFTSQPVTTPPVNMNILCTTFIIMINTPYPLWKFLSSTKFQICNNSMDKIAELGSYLTFQLIIIINVLQSFNF